MPYGCFPPSLPAPQSAVFTPAARVRRNDAAGAFNSTLVERDFRGTQEVTWPPLTPEQCQVLRSYFDGLAYGGEWFVTNTWPTPKGWGAHVVRRFVGELRWQHVARGRWRCSATTEVMGNSTVIEENSPCGGSGGYVCGESGPEFWMLDLDPPAVNEFDRPPGGSYDITSAANWRPWVLGAGGIVGNLFTFQDLLVRRYNVIRAPGGGLVSATPDTTTDATTLPPAEAVFLPSGLPADLPPLFYVDEGDDNDGSVWRVEPPSFEFTPGVLRLGGGSQLLVTISGGGAYADIALEYACLP